MKNLFLFLFLMASVTACSDDGGQSRASIPTIEVREGVRVLRGNDAVTLRSGGTAQIAVSNIGDGPLHIQELLIESSVDGAFEIESIPTPQEIDPIVLLEDAEPHYFEIRHIPGAGEAQRPTAVVTINTNLTLNSRDRFRFSVNLEETRGLVKADPPVLNFSTSADSHSERQEFKLINLGANTVEIDRVIFSGSDKFTFEIIDEGVEYAVTAESASTGITLNPPLSLSAASAAILSATFRSEDPDSAEGRLVFYPVGDDQGVQVALYANLEGPCILASPAHIAFGAKSIGTESIIDLEIESCGDMDLTITDIEMIDDGNGQFSVDENALGAFPVVIPPGERRSVPVSFFPEAAAQSDGQGGFQLETGLLRVSSDAYLRELDIDIDGFGAPDDCPIAKIDVAEGTDVLPQTNLHLSGASSIAAAGGTIVGYEWSVVQPSGSGSFFSPNASIVNPTFEANVMGTYTFRLDVVDSFGNRSCSPAELKVVAVSDDAIHVELLWHTPNHPNETNEGFNATGADMDLHFAREQAGGTFNYFSSQDCYWNNLNPNWGFAGTADTNPRLDRDDVNGVGPENLNLKRPEPDMRYEVAVHYYDDWGCGQSRALVRVYIYGRLIDEWNNVWMNRDEFWRAFHIKWPETTVTRLGGGSPLITPDRVHGGRNPSAGFRCGDSFGFF